MNIAIVPNRNSPQAVLLRESGHKGGKIVKKTLSGLPPRPHRRRAPRARRQGRRARDELLDATKAALVKNRQ